MKTLRKRGAKVKSRATAVAREVAREKKARFARTKKAGAWHILKSNPEAIIEVRGARGEIVTIKTGEKGVVEVVKGGRLGNESGIVIRDGSRVGKRSITKEGTVVARSAFKSEVPALPYFARRQFADKAFGRLIEAGQVGVGGTDSALAISESRDGR